MFFTRIFLEFGVNIGNSAERSSAYCHYSMFFWSPQLISIPSDVYGRIFNTVLRHQKMWNNGEYVCDDFVASAGIAKHQYLLSHPIPIQSGKFRVGKWSAGLRFVWCCLLRPSWSMRTYFMHVVPQCFRAVCDQSLGPELGAAPTTRL